MNVATTRLQAFSIFDKKAAAYMPPFFMPTSAMAIRAFSQDVKNSQTMISKFPDDFELYRIGQFDDFSGALSSFEPVELISRASDFVYADLSNAEGIDISQLRTVK